MELLLSFRVTQKALQLIVLLFFSPLSHLFFSNGLVKVFFTNGSSFVTQEAFDQYRRVFHCTHS